MTYNQQKIRLIDVPAILLAAAIAVPFVLVLIAPFTAGL